MYGQADKNCEAGWIGVGVLSYSSSGLGVESSHAIVRYGSALSLGGKNNIKALNDYMYQVFDESCGGL
jgi:hypothetical protein